MSQRQYNWKMTIKQAEAFDILEKDEANSLLFGGGKGGGKSHALCNFVLYLCLKIIKECEITKRQPHPIRVGWLGRVVGQDFTGTTLATWKEEIPSGFYKIKGNPAVIVIDDKVQIDTGGLDRSDGVNKFNSAQYMFFGLDQAEEATLEQIGELRGSLRKKINGKHIPYKEIYTANPAECWLKEDFITSPKPKHYFIPALYKDNPYLPEDYPETLEKSFKHREGLLRAYRDGDWDSFETDDQIIKGIWLTSAKQVILHDQHERIYISCDPAAFGNDETVIYLMDRTKIIDSIIFGQKETMYTANKLIALSRQNGDCPIVIDPLGPGEGVASRLREMCASVIEVRNSEAAENPHYYNKRAEVWDTAAQMFSELNVQFNSEDPTLRSQLCTPKFFYKGGRFIVEPKEEIRKRLGASPDRADAYVNALYVYSKHPELLTGATKKMDMEDYIRKFGSAMAC